MKIGHEEKIDTRRKGEYDELEEKLKVIGIMEKKESKQCPEDYVLCNFISKLRH